MVGDWTSDVFHVCGVRKVSLPQHADSAAGILENEGHIY